MGESDDGRSCPDGQVARLINTRVGRAEDPVQARLPLGGCQTARLSTASRKDTD